MVNPSKIIIVACFLTLVVMSGHVALALPPFLNNALQKIKGLFQDTSAESKWVKRTGGNIQDVIFLKERAVFANTQGAFGSMDLNTGDVSWVKSERSEVATNVRSFPTLTKRCITLPSPR